MIIIDKIYENKIIMIVDEDLRQKYLKYYFGKYPKRKKEPIDESLHPSINKWFIMKRPQMNDFKQKWKEFSMWIVAYYGLTNKKIKKCRMTYEFYYKTKRRQDNDNRTPKFTNDGFVEAGLILDDDYEHLNPLILSGNYDKEHSRMEIIIEY